jgi:hypothetical protein
MTTHAVQDAIGLPKLTFRDRDFSYRIEFLERPFVVAATTSGQAVVSGWARLHKELLADPRVRGLPLLIDHSDLDGTFLSNDDVRMLGQMVTDLDKELQSPRRAVVLTAAFEFGLARLCHSYLDADVETRIRPFRTREGALAWLGE